MSFINKYKSYVAKASTGFAGAAGQTLNTSAVIQNEQQAISCLCVATIATANVIYSYKWQASDDNSTWVDVKDWNNAAYVTVTASGSTWLCAPPVASKFLRVQCITSGAGTAVVTDDLFAATWKILNK